MYTYRKRIVEERVMAFKFEDSRTAVMKFMNDLIGTGDVIRPTYNEAAGTINVGAGFLYKGEWVVYDADGRFTVVPDEAFNKRYEEAT